MHLWAHRLGLLNIVAAAYIKPYVHYATLNLHDKFSCHKKVSSCMLPKSVWRWRYCCIYLIMFIFLVLFYLVNIENRSVHRSRSTKLVNWLNYYRSYVQQNLSRSSSSVNFSVSGVEACKQSYSTLSQHKLRFVFILCSDWIEYCTNTCCDWICRWK